MDDDAKSPLGLVLSGGGARGVAQIGVIRALVEAELEPDWIAGASAGALVGAMYAAGLSSEAMLECFLTRSPFRLSHLAFGQPGIFDASKSIEELAEVFPVSTFEELKRRLRVATTDLVSGEEVIFDSGPLLPAVVASCSFPLVFTPTEVGKRWLSDGGILDNFPVGLIRDRCRRILGVHVSPLRAVAHSDLDSMMAVSNRALELTMHHHACQFFVDCDVLIAPESLALHRTFDTRGLSELVELGYQAALPQLEALRGLLNEA